MSMVHHGGVVVVLLDLPARQPALAPYPDVAQLLSWSGMHAGAAAALSAAMGLYCVWAPHTGMPSRHITAFKLTPTTEGDSISSPLS